MERLSDEQFENVWECVSLCVCLMVQTQGFSYGQRLYRQQIRGALEQRASNLNFHHNPFWTSISQPIIFSQFYSFYFRIKSMTCPFFPPANVVCQKFLFLSSGLIIKIYNYFMSGYVCNLDKPQRSQQFTRQQIHHS